MKPLVFAGVLIGLCCFAAQAQTFKCRDAQGRTTYSDSPCSTSSQSETIDTRNRATAEQARQAREVYERDAARVQRIEVEKAAEQPRTARRSDMRDACVARVESTSGISQRRRASLLASCHEPSVVNNTSAENVRSCLAKIDSLKGISQWNRVSAEVRCYGAAVGGEERSGPERVQHTAHEPARITSCDAGGCWDTQGRRYNGTGQTLFRSDGQTCNRSGPTLICQP